MTAIQLQLFVSAQPLHLGALSRSVQRHACGFQSTELLRAQPVRVLVAAAAAIRAVLPLEPPARDLAAAEAAASVLSRYVLPCSTAMASRPAGQV